MRAAAPAITSDHRFSDRDQQPVRPAHMGVVVGTIIAALLAGLTAGTFGALGSPRLALSVVTLVVVSCIASTRRLRTNRIPTFEEVEHGGTSHVAS